MLPRTKYTSYVRRKFKVTFVGGGPLPELNAVAADHALGAPFLGANLTQRWSTRAPIDFALGRIASHAIMVFSAERARLTRCALASCGALLLSRARNEPRRWCSMETCGNRAKVAAHRARKNTRGDQRIPP